VTIEKHALEIRATNDERDAPVFEYRHADGSMKMMRDNSEPGEEWDLVTYFPHAVVFVDGQMSGYDADRRGDGT
jgi:hypothetical protein